MDLVGNASKMRVTGLSDSHIPSGRSSLLFRYHWKCLAELFQTWLPHPRDLFKLPLRDFYWVAAHPRLVVIVGKQDHRRSISRGMQTQKVGGTVLSRNVVDHASPLHGEFPERITKRCPGIDDQRSSFRSISANSHVTHCAVGFRCWREIEASGHIEVRRRVTSDRPGYQQTLNIGF